MAGTTTISIYLPKPLWDKVQEAEATSPGFKATEYCKNQLAALLDGRESVKPPIEPPSEQDKPVVVDEERPDGSSTIRFAGHPEDQQVVADALRQDFTPLDPEYDYDITFQETLTSSVAFVNEVVQPQGAQVVSMTIDPVGRFAFLVGWPKS